MIILYYMFCKGSTIFRIPNLIVSVESCFAFSNIYYIRYSNKHQKNK